MHYVTKMLPLALHMISYVMNILFCPTLVGCRHPSELSPEHSLSMVLPDWHDVNYHIMVLPPHMQGPVAIYSRRKMLRTRATHQSCGQCYLHDMHCSYQFVFPFESREEHLWRIVVNNGLCHFRH